MDMLSSNTGLMGWVDYLPVYVDNSATDAWAITATGFIPYAPSGGISLPAFTVTMTALSNALGTVTTLAYINPGSGGGGSSPAFTVTMTALSNASGVVTTLAYISPGGGGGGVITPSVSAARTSGVAPLYVNFDATGTTSTLTTRPIHDLDYGWDFADTGAGTWANGVQSAGLASKNADRGPISGHVFETAGTYIVAMGVSDAAGNSAVETVEITVADPDTVFSGTNTICFSTSGTFTGKPTGAQEVAVSAGGLVAAFDTYKGTNKRILLCAGESWTNTTAMSINMAGPFTIGRYGTGANPNIINGLTPSTTHAIQFGASAVDIRVLDVDVDGESFKGTGDCTQVTILRCNALSQPTGVTFDSGETAPLNNYDQLCIEDCSFKLDGSHTFGATSGYIGAQRASLNGNVWDNNKFGEQVLRIPNMNRSTVKHNLIKLPLSAKNALKFHASNFVSTSQYTEKVCVSANVLDNRDGNYGILEFIVAGNGRPSDERVRDFIFESNIAYCDKTNPVDGAGFILLGGAQRMTIRNNIADFRGTTDYQYTTVGLVNIDSNASNGGTAVAEIRVYNNTFYGDISGTGSGWSGPEVDVLVRNYASDTTDVIAKNNIVYAPSSTRNAEIVFYNPSGASGFSESNNSTSKSTSPLLTTMPPAVLADWVPTGPSYAVNTGTPTPALRDFNNATRVGGTYDMGAVLP
jgi:hypothetical protein